MRDFLTALIECSASMSVLALVLMALTPLLAKRYAAKWIYYAWLVVAAGPVFPFRVHLHPASLRAPALPSPPPLAPPRSAGRPRRSRGCRSSAPYGWRAPPLSFCTTVCGMPAFSGW